MGMQSPKRDQESPGRRPGEPVANEAVAASRTKLKVGHEAPEGSRSQPPARYKDDPQAQKTQAFLSEAPLRSSEKY
jgi:hypothetical protein